jgi:hypothetical protein
MTATFLAVDGIGNAVTDANVLFTGDVPSTMYQGQTDVNGSENCRN